MVAAVVGGGGVASGSSGSGMSSGNTALHGRNGQLKGSRASCRGMAELLRSASKTRLRAQEVERGALQVALEAWLRSENSRNVLALLKEHACACSCACTRLHGSSEVVVVV